MCYDKLYSYESSIGGDIMPVSKADQRAVAKYVKNNYDRIEVKVPKGYKADVQNHAAGRKESINGFVNRAIRETMERDKGE